MSFLEFLKLNKDARKVFGERELKIIEKQLYGINLTQSEKNRLSRDIRKKLDFIKEAARFSDEFKLKKAGIIKSIVEEARVIILNSNLFNKIRRIILYGSAVENQLTFKSDIDITVEFSEISLREATTFRKSVLGKTNPRVDVQVYNYLPQKIKKEIESKGKVIYKSENN
ncbi:MAG TPA: nucleotidyltransferase domain-containing protein [Candidatus Nanoarchaeia archaeon]|nr:nucleotidyltransferase domain-containing protein [Candidatus Nanoarchaeia archaeon]